MALWGHMQLEEPERGSLKYENQGQRRAFYLDLKPVSRCVSVYETDTAPALFHLGLSLTSTCKMRV